MLLTEVDTIESLLLNYTRFLQIIRYCFFLVFTLFFIKKISVQFVLINIGFPVFYCICLHRIGIGASYLFIVSRILGRSSESLLVKYPSLLISICPPTEALLVCFSFLFFLFCVVFVLFLLLILRFNFCSGSKTNYYYY